MASLMAERVKMDEVLSSTWRSTGLRRRSSKGQWTAEEDELLCRAVRCFKGKNWRKIAECIPNRTAVQCLHRWRKVLNLESIKGPWSREEDEMIIELVSKYGPKKWSIIAKSLPGRVGKQCRERWHNHLNPAINNEAWTQEEELALIKAHQIYGNKWVKLTKFLPGRTDNAIKNHWNCSVKKKLDSYLTASLLAPLQGSSYVGNLNGSYITRPTLLQSSVGIASSNSTKNILVDSDELEPLLMSDNDCSEITGSETVMVGNFLIENAADLSNNIDWDMEDDCSEITDSETVIDGNFLSENAADLSNNIDWDMEKSALYQQSDLPSSRTTGTPALKSYATWANFIKHALELADLTSPPSDFICVVGEKDKAGDLMKQDELVPKDVFISADAESMGPLPSMDDKKSQHLKSYGKRKYSALAPMNLSSLESSDSAPTHPSMDENSPVLRKKQNSISLFYESPRLDIPYVTCDLNVSGSEMQPEYSPFGIRQILNFSGPCSLGDSPCSISLLKNATKSFTSTPSILKKQPREVAFDVSNCRERLQYTRF